MIILFLNLIKNEIIYNNTVMSAGYSKAIGRRHNACHLCHVANNVLEYHAPQTNKSVTNLFCIQKLRFDRVLSYSFEALNEKSVYYNLVSNCSYE